MLTSAGLDNYAVRPQYSRLFPLSSISVHAGAKNWIFVDSSTIAYTVVFAYLMKTVRLSCKCIYYVHAYMRIRTTHFFLQMITPIFTLKR